jgi:hypothetical protein
MPELDYAAMGKEALRAEMRERELSYSRMNNDQMRAALRANDAEMADVLDAENDFEMTKEERAAQTPRQNLITVETADGPTEVDLNKLAIDPSNNPGPRGAQRRQASQQGRRLPRSLGLPRHLPGNGPPRPVRQGRPRGSTATQLELEQRPPGILPVAEVQRYQRSRQVSDINLSEQRANNLKLRSLRLRLKVLRVAPEATPESIANLEQQITELEKQDVR